MKFFGVNKKTIIASTIVTSFIISANAFAHSRVTPGAELSPRNPNTLGSTRAPCGGDARGATSVQLVAGSEVVFQFEETRPHNGSFRIAFSPANDEGFDDNIIMDNIPDVGNPQNGEPVKYEQKITVPDTPCEACTLQLKFNLNNPYYSCTDIKIVEAVQNQPPAAQFTASSEEGKVPFTIMFDAAATTDDAEGVTYSWDFGDGSEAVSGVTAQHTFNTPGDYTVKLTATDIAGLTNEITTAVKALNADALLAALSPDLFLGVVPLSVKLTAEQSDEITNYQWKIAGIMRPEFDGMTEIEATFEEPGRHQVALIITDATGATDEKSVMLTAQYNALQMSPMEFATVLMEDFDDLDEDADGLLTFDFLNQSFVNINTSALTRIDTNGDQTVSKSELTTYINQSADNGNDDNTGDGDTGSTPPDNASSDDAPAESVDSESTSSSSTSTAGNGATLLLVLFGAMFCRMRTRR
ncbi:MAG: PKD domain-containing protein [Pseudomonadota bacterium]